MTPPVPRRLALWTATGLGIGALILFGLALVSARPAPAQPFCKGDGCVTAWERRQDASEKAHQPTTYLIESLVGRWPLTLRDQRLADCAVQSQAGVTACQLDDLFRPDGAEAGLLLALSDADTFLAKHRLQGCSTPDGCRAIAMIAVAYYRPTAASIRTALLQTVFPLDGTLVSDGGVQALEQCKEQGAASRDLCDPGALVARAPVDLAVVLGADWVQNADQIAPEPAGRLPAPLAWIVALSVGVGLLAGGGLVAGRNLILSNFRQPADEGNRDGQDVSGDRNLSPVRSAGPADAARRPLASGPRFDFLSPVSGSFAWRRGPLDENASAARRLAARTAPAQPVFAPAASGSDPEIPPPVEPAPDQAGEIERFRQALSIALPHGVFLSEVETAAAQLDPAIERGPRLAMAAILASHGVQGDRPASRYAKAYERLVDRLAGPGHIMVWPEPGSPLDGGVESTAERELYSHVVDFVIRPGLADPHGHVLVRPRVMAR